jgi:hypothetical protein
MKYLSQLEKNNRNTVINRTYKKLAVQWLNEALCFYQRLCLVDSEVLPCLPVGREIANFL